MCSCSQPKTARALTRTGSSYPGKLACCPFQAPANSTDSLKRVQPRSRNTAQWIKPATCWSAAHRNIKHTHYLTVARADWLSEPQTQWRPINSRRVVLKGGELRRPKRDKPLARKRRNPYSSCCYAIISNSGSRHAFETRISVGPCTRVVYKYT